MVLEYPYKPTSQEVATELNRLMQKSQSYMLQKSPLDVIVCCDRMIRIAPDFAVAWANKSRYLEKLGRLEEALECTKIAVRLFKEQGYPQLTVDEQQRLEKLESNLKQLKVEKSQASQKGAGVQRHSDDFLAEFLSSSQRKIARSSGETFRESGSATLIQSHIMKVGEYTPYKIAKDEFERITDKWPHVSGYMSFSKLKLVSLRDSVKKFLAEKFFIVDNIEMESEDGGEYGFNCSAKFNDKILLMAIVVKRNVEQINLKHLVFTLYSSQPKKELRLLLEDFAILLSEYITRQTGKEEVIVPVQQVKMSIIDSIIYKSQIGTKGDIKVHIVDSIVSRLND